MQSIERSENEPPCDWFNGDRNFFGSDYLEEHAKAIAPGPTIAEVDFLERTLSAAKEGLILDLGAGHGRHSIELAQRGYDVAALDINGYFLTVGKNNAHKANARVLWTLGDFRRLPFRSEAFSALISMFTSFGFLDTDDDDFAVVEDISRVLRGSGRAVIDLINREAVLGNFRDNDHQELPDGTIILDERSFDLMTGRLLHKRIRISPQGERDVRFARIRLYALSEIAKLCERAGLAIADVTGNYQGSPYDLSSPRCILILDKREPG